MDRRDLLGAALVLSVAATPAVAWFLDEAHTVQITGKAFTQASLRMQDSDSSGRDCVFLAQPNTRCTGFTFPQTNTGQLIQNRNLLDVELTQQLIQWVRPVFPQLDTLNHRVRVKYFYEGVYDYGPRAYSVPSSHLTPQGQPDSDGQNGLRINRHLDTQHDPLWNAYVDAASGPLWVRLGRQDLSWGESDGFRLLDMIEPLDNRFGFPLVEDLDDRRIPLWMLRAVWHAGSWGALSNLALEGYWVPGTIDDQEAPIPRSGNPFAPPAPPGPADIIIPSKNLGNSRGGGRLLATLFERTTLSLAHYVTYNDAPSLRLAVNTLAPVPDTPFLVEYYQQQITGASLTSVPPFDPYSVLRVEIAQFWDERVFIPDQNANAAALVSQFIASGGQPQTGALPTRNTLRWMIGWDRNVWLRWLNPDNSFLFSAQYFQTDIVSYTRQLSSAAVSSIEFPAAGAPVTNTVPRKNDEIMFTYIVNTLYRHGTLAPALAGAYDTRGVHVLVPSLTYQLGTNVQIALKYAIITGTFANLGVFRDRDELLLRVQYNLS
jgi:hypothetical protein